MLSITTSCTVLGINGWPVEVEVDVASGLPTFSTVGLPDNSIRESRERVKSAIKNCGYQFPNKRITVNLSPADLKKEGAGFDLPIAVGILKATEVFTVPRPLRYCLVGELSLDGAVKRVGGILPMVLAAKEMGCHGIIIPHDNAAEASIAPNGIEIIPVKSLPQVVEFLAGLEPIPPLLRKDLQDSECESFYNEDFSDIRGQKHAKRALEIAASGGHNLLLKGPPGAGKTMLARRFPTILPSMTIEEIIETTKIYSVAVSGLTKDQVQIRRPFRAPHHTVSDAGLIGGGTIPQPGEVSFAHNGVLFLDELPEFKKHVLEVLRQPLEDGIVTIARANMTLTFPARFTLIAAMNPCPCGYYGDARNRCNCTESDIKRYVSRISGPLIDRIDMHLEVAGLEFIEMSGVKDGESSKVIKSRVDVTRSIQSERFSGFPGIYNNSQMPTKLIEQFCTLDSQSTQILERSITRFGLSARTYHRILKLARTIADMEMAQNIRAHHVAEAVQLCRGVN